MRALVALLLLLPASLPAQTFTVGSRVHANASVCARPDTLVVGTGCGTGGVLRVVGDHGTLVRGPAGSSTPFGVSWFVDYDVGQDGWSTAKYLTLDSVVVPPPPPPPPPSVVAVLRIDGFTQGALTLLPQTSHQFQAIATDAAGVVVPVAFAWRASAPAVASVDANGLVTARSAGIGQDTVSATAPNGVRAFFLVNVPFTQPVTPLCGLVVPPPVGCGLKSPTWSLMGIDTANGTYGPWYRLDSLGHPIKVLRVVQRDTTF